jgi:hypothetical protein
MSYTVVVEIKVVNTEGEVVDHKGYPHMNPQRNFHPLQTEQRFVTFEDVEKAHNTLNVLHGVVKQMQQL